MNDRQKVCVALENGRAYKCDNISTDGATIFSYDLPIACVRPLACCEEGKHQWPDAALLVLNAAKSPSKTTKHINFVLSFFKKAIVVDDLADKRNDVVLESGLYQ